MTTLFPNTMGGMGGGRVAQQRVRKCGTCNGDGKRLVMGEETCSSCAGTGRDMKSRVYSQPCRSCNGAKKKSYCRREGTCYSCKGQGVVPY